MVPAFTPSAEAIYSLSYPTVPPVGTTYSDVPMGTILIQITANGYPENLDLSPLASEFDGNAIIPCMNLMVFLSYCAS